MKRRYRFWPAGILVVAVLGLWHLIMVRGGAAGSGDSWLTGWYLTLLVIAVAAAGITGFLFFGMYREKERTLEQIYPAAGFLLGLLYLAVLPPLSAPDEISHYISAYQLSSRMLGQPAENEDGYVLVRARDWFVEDVYGEYPYEQAGNCLVKKAGSAEDEQAGTVLGQVLEEKTYRVIHDTALGEYENPWLKQTGKGELAASPYPAVVTTPLAYVPQALGISLARLLNLNSLWLLYLGRLFNLIFFVGMTWFSMKRMPFGKEVLFGTAILPMTLHLSASFSYDVIIMACMFLFTAICLDLAYRKEKAEVRDILLLAVIMGVAGPCKMVYAALMGLCLLIPVKKFGGWGKWLLSAVVVAGAWAIAMVLVNGPVVAGYATATESLASGTNEAGYNLAMLFHQPGLLMQVFYNTLVHQADEYHLTMIGAWLGNLDPVLNVPYLAVVLFTCGLLLLAFRKPGENLYVPAGGRIWIVLVCAGCTAALMLSMLISCTTLSSPLIQGVQGRYFLPFLPALLIACKNDRLVLTKNGNRSILYMMCCANLYVVLQLFSTVCVRL